VEFTALNGGPKYKFNEAVSFVVRCEDQNELDELWERLSEGGEKGQRGWLKDKFGISWQIVPVVLAPMLTDLDAQKSQRVMEALLEMDKIDIAGLQRAFEGERAA
jgi:predicted 3-demethylubiquinone-9 3-methyltransferase (glyoxalase superfamily)